MCEWLAGVAKKCPRKGRQCVFLNTHKYFIANMCKRLDMTSFSILKRNMCLTVSLYVMKLHRRLL